mgnify:CR=1 FL=1
MTEQTRSLADLIRASGLPDDTSVRALEDPGVTTAPVAWHTTKPLTRADVLTFGDLTDYTDEALVGIPFFGPNRLKALKAAVRGAGTETP